MAGVKLLDFGIAKQYTLTDRRRHDQTRRSHELRTPRPAQLVGTLPYMAPEQLEGAPVDARADIFAFGAVVFEMATGHRAFEGSSPAAVVAAILGDARPRLCRPRAGLPGAGHLISACLERDPVRTVAERV